MAGQNDLGRSLKLTLYDSAGDGFGDTDLINGTKRTCADPQSNPLTRFRHEEFLGLQVRIETALGLTVRVTDVVPGDGMFTGEVTNLGHDFSFKDCKGSKISNQDK